MKKICLYLCCLVYFKGSGQVYIFINLFIFRSKATSRKFVPVVDYVLNVVCSFFIYVKPLFLWTIGSNFISLLKLDKHSFAKNNLFILDQILRQHFEQQWHR